MSNKEISKLIDFRDGLLRILTDVTESTLEADDDYVSNKIKEYKDKCPPEIDMTEYLDKVGFFWDISIAAMKANANKSFQEVCEGFEYKKPQSYSNMLDIAIASDNAMALDLLLRKGWAKESATLVEKALRSLSASTFRYIQARFPEAVRETLDVNARNKKDARAGFDWAMCLVASGASMIVMRDNDVLFKKRLGLFVTNLRPEIEFGWNLAPSGKEKKYKSIFMMNFLSGMLSTIAGMSGFSSKNIQGLHSAYLSAVLEAIDIFSSNGFGSKDEWEKTLKYVCEDKEAVADYRQLLEFIGNEITRSDLLKMVSLDGTKLSSIKLNTAL